MPAFNALPTELSQPRRDRVEAGRSRRVEAPRSAHRELRLADARDPLAILEAQNRARLADLVPVRWGRMAQSPFAFLRGAAAVMAADLAATPTTGLTVQTCGDAHLMNFGGFASLERREVFDLNDFDETLPGPWEWDVKRLAASATVAALDHGFDPSTARSIATDAIAAYCDKIAELSDSGVLETWYLQVELEREVLPRLTKAGRTMTRAAIDKMRSRHSVGLLPKLTALAGDTRRIVDHPPLITHTGLLENEADLVEEFFERYFESLSPARRLLLRRFRLVDIARKVVGVGSVGTRCYIALLMTGDDEPLFLQIKEAPPSILEPYCGTYGGPGGRRVVEGQQLIQTAGDALLGWASSDTPHFGNLHFYVRQLRDMKQSVNLAELQHLGFTTYLRLCGATLARAHARTGDGVAIAAYLGGGRRFTEAVGQWAADYAEVTTADHARLVEAIADGTIEAQMGL
jgi:uncharacterized protein (DUF2252 family)